MVILEIMNKGHPAKKDVLYSLNYSSLELFFIIITPATTKITNNNKTIISSSSTTLPPLFYQKISF